MDMWKPFRQATAHHAPQARILFDKFHVLRHLGDALDQVRKSEYARVGSASLWDYGREGWAHRFFEDWRAALKWQRLGPYEKFAALIARHWEGIAAYCRPENKVALGFVEGLNNKIRVLQRRAYELRDEEYLRLKILTHSRTRLRRPFMRRRVSAIESEIAPLRLSFSNRSSSSPGSPRRSPVTRSAHTSSTASTATCASRSQARLRSTWRYSSNRAGTMERSSDR
jgi:hypothetical protein